MIGIFGTSCLQQAWGVTIWNQWDVYDAMLDRHWTGPARLGVFLLALASALFNFGAILGANLLPFASDATALLPRYFNLTRGMWFCCLVSLALMPWKILASANGFLAFLDGYGIFMGPTAAIMITDYWIVHKGNIVIADAYTSVPGSRYTYVLPRRQPQRCLCLLLRHDHPVHGVRRYVWRARPTRCDALSGTRVVYLGLRRGRGVCYPLPLLPARQR